MTSSHHIDTKAPLVIIGASLGGVSAAGALRDNGYQGRIILLGAEPTLPYDRPPLSKGLLSGKLQPEQIRLHDEDFFKQRGIELIIGKHATSIDLAGRRVCVDRTSWIGYASLVIASGARARTLPSLSGFANVFCLRSLADALQIRAALQDSRRVAIVGGGFIGTEVASIACARGLEVTIVDQQDRLFRRAAGSKFGERVARLQVERGATLKLETGIAGLVGEGRLEALELSDGSVLPADMVVVGIGAVPCTDYLESSGLRLDDGVVCNAGGLAAPDVYALGDVARWCDDDGAGTRSEHWTNAVHQARRVAATIAASAGGAGRAAEVAADLIPYVWSDQHQGKFQFHGDCRGAGDERHVESAGERFASIYSSRGLITGIATFKWPALSAAGRMLISQRSGVEAVDPLLLRHGGPQRAGSGPGARAGQAEGA
jgi:3-phenylpropionate/trans-cinnamate dioxygenase ferredoxin reductase subunit